MKTRCAGKITAPLVTVAMCGLGLFSSSLHAACTSSGGVASCTGDMSTAAPISMTTPGVAVTNLDGITMVYPGPPTPVPGVFVQQFNNSTTANYDIAVHMNSGVLDTAGSDFFPVHIRNSGYGMTDTTVSGAILGGGIRQQMNLAANTSANGVLVNAPGVIDSLRTAIWLRDQSQGTSTIDIYGQVRSAYSRGVHLSNNNTADASESAVNVLAGGSVTSGNQGLYVGNMGSGDITVGVDGVVSGGVDDVALNTFDDYSAGVVLDATAGNASLTVGASGQLDSRNDVAVVDYRGRATAAGGVTAVINHGSLTGSLWLGESDNAYANADQLENTGTILLRNFADTDFDGVRDTEGDALIDFGAGDDMFVNTGRLVLASVASTTTPGIEAGVISGLESFSAGGVISLQDVDGGGAAPVAGDTLTVSGGLTVTGAAQLKLDVVLGDDASAADRLMLQDVAVGSGPVTLVIANAGGIGAATTGLGILVVEVAGTSPATAFSMAPVTAGGYVYSLVQADGRNWYLQSAVAPVAPAANDDSAVPVPVMGPMQLLLTVLTLGLLALRQRARPG